MPVRTVAQKTHIPQAPAGYIDRPRLNSLWETWAGKRLVTVTAGAGFGKTSFLSACARLASRPVAWMNLDERDVDLATFVAHLLQALEAGGPPHEQGREPAEKSALASPGAAGGSPPGLDSTDPAFAQQVLANALDLLSRGAGRALILDDAHSIAGSPPVLRFLDELVRYAPRGATIVLSGREPLAIATQKARCAGEGAALTHRDLAFRIDEIGLLLARRYPGMQIASRYTRRLMKKTEGWAAGIEIFLQSFPALDRHALERALNRPLEEGTGWFEYFAEQVLSGLDERTQDFLARTSVLGLLDATSCNRLLRIQDGAARLQELARRNLFTISLGDEERYRYHHLFRAFLRDRLRARLSERSHRAHMRKAGELLARSGDCAEAAEAFREAGEPDAILALIERTGERRLAAGEHRALQRAFALLPERRLRGRPQAMFLLGRLCDLQQRWDEAEKHYRRALRLSRSLPRRMELMSLVAQLASRHGAHRAALAMCRRALDTRARASQAARARIHSTMGVCLSELGRPDEGERSFLEARRLHRGAKDAAEEARIDYLLAINVYLRRGEFARARETARRALARFRRLRNPRRICYSLGVLSYISSEMNDLAAAGELGEQLLSLARALGQRQQEALAYLILGRCALAAGDLDAAGGQFGRALALGEDLHERDLRVLPRLGLARWNAARGNRRAARALAQEAFEIVHAMEDPLHAGRCALLLAELALPGDRAGARRWWRRADVLFERAQAAPEKNRVLLARIDAGDLDGARAEAALGELLSAAQRPEVASWFRLADKPRCARVLARALEQGIEVEQAIRLLMDIGEPAVSLLAPLVKGDEAVRLRAVDALARIGGAQARALLASVARQRARSGGRGNPAIAMPSAARAAEELARIPDRPLRIHALGELRVQAGERELHPQSWRSTRALRLFQLLLVRRFRWVAKDEIIEALWPGSEPEKGKDSLWQSVFHLRRILEPDLEELRDSHYVRFHHEAYRLEPGEAGLYDVLAFEGALREGKRLLVGGRKRAAQRRLREAVDLYRGDFLADSPYEELATVERETLRDQFLSALGSLANLAESAGCWEECIDVARRGLAQDPFGEMFHRAAVQGLFMLGRRGEALSAYLGYEKAMLRELRLPPSPAMKALAERMAASRPHP